MHMMATKGVVGLVLKSFPNFVITIVKLERK